MHRTNGAGNVAGMFVSEDAATNRPPTEVTPAWLNSVQEELAGLVEWAGLTLSEADNTQVRQALIAKVLPAGSVIYYAAPSAPAGYLKANGAAVSRTTYAALFAAIGTLFGVGDGSTTFVLPDLRGEFLRGWDDGRGVDSGRTLGSAQVDDFKSHTHTHISYAPSGSGYADGTTNGLVPLNTGATGGTETRPRNVALLACIKY